ncbi:hypothetical protein [Paraflavitalea sp. CAU 1676]|uniref:hypothetical protein n=1 Tax=Paraflavitalea sp. CAU 1676 TaxID=3032598 RepID=UPI0023DA0554|nr:hypothetical protein [Paraflavitalea sp. CAU 1676]MDF2191565.1 hypothetical protein [Paraflavitalea sp. CAU 1676]
MLQRKVKTILFMLFMFSCIEGYNQTMPVSKRNLQVLDSCEQARIAGFCQGPITYTVTFKERLIKRDQRVMPLLNVIFDSKATPASIRKAAANLGGLKVRPRGIEWNGLIRVERSRVLANYFILDYQIESIDSVIIRKKMLLETYTKSTCNGTAYKVPDFRLLRGHLVPLLTFPITMRDVIYLYADTLLETNLARLATQYQDYSFATTTGIAHDTANQVLRKQFNSDRACCYERMRIDRDILALAGQNRIDVLKLLLYSPSYYYAVQAMEALIYLEHQGKITFTEPLKEKIRLIKQSNNPITYQTAPDVEMIVKGYQAFRMNDEEIINKYSFYLSPNKK